MLLMSVTKATDTIFLQTTPLNRDIAGLNALDAGLLHSAQALASEPWVSMPRQASSITKVSKPALRASSARPRDAEIGGEAGQEQRFNLRSFR